MKIEYIMRHIIGGNFKEETMDESIVRTLTGLIPEDRMGVEIILRHMPDDSKSTGIQCNGKCRIVVGMPHAVAVAWCEAFDKFDDPTIDAEIRKEFEEAVERLKAVGLSERILKTIKMASVKEKGWLEVHEGASDDELANTYSYHPPMAGQKERYEIIRDVQKQMASILGSLCPPSSEREVALERLNEVGFWANAAIARNELEPIVVSSKDAILEQIELVRPIYESESARREAKPTEEPKLSVLPDPE